jgi:hypothetical protein
MICLRIHLYHYSHTQYVHMLLKKTFLVATMFAAFSTFSYAQTVSDKAVKECCTCLTKLKSKTLTDEAMREASTECITLALTENVVGLCKEYGFKLDDMNEETGRQIGERFSLKLLSDCPESTDALMKIGLEEIKNNPDATRNFIKPQGSVTVTIKSVETLGNLTKVSATDADGKPQIFFWMQAFGGDQFLIKKMYAGKKFKLTFGKQEFYNSTKSAYQTMQVILELSAI